MPRKPKPKADDPDEYKRFVEAAKQLEADQDSKAFEKAFDKIAKPKLQKKRKPLAKTQR